MLATAGALFYVFFVAVLNLCFGFATARYVASRFKRHDDAVDAAAAASLANPNEDPSTLDAETEPGNLASDEAVLEKAAIE